MKQKLEDKGIDVSKMTDDEVRAKFNKAGKAKKQTSEMFDGDMDDDPRALNGREVYGNTGARDILERISELTGIDISQFDMQLKSLAEKVSDAVGDVIGNNYPMAFEDLEDDAASDEVAELVMEYITLHI